MTESRATKTIKITEELFRPLKTKKPTTAKRQKIHMVNPKDLRKEFLARIKQKVADDSTRPEKTATTQKDEFEDSMDYLKSLSLELSHPQTHNKTLKHVGGTKSPMVYLGLDEKLEEKRDFPMVEVVSEPIMLKKYSALPDQPYGNLKNGTKQTYRNYVKNQSPTLDRVVTKANTDFGTHSEQLPKMEQPLPVEKRPSFLPLHTASPQPQPQPPHVFIGGASDDESLKHESLKHESLKHESLKHDSLKHESLKHESLKHESLKHESLKHESLKHEFPQDDLEGHTRITKRTILKKYTLGKSKLYRRVSVLLKDNTTRKNVIDAQKELKRKSIADVKRYLKDRGLLKAGSNAPNDVVRKTYESAMLTGDVINKNKETLIHNLLSE